MRDSCLAQTLCCQRVREMNIGFSSLMAGGLIALNHGLNNLTQLGTLILIVSNNLPENLIISLVKHAYLFEIIHFSVRSAPKTNLPPRWPSATVRGSVERFNARKKIIATPAPSNIMG